MEEMEIDAKAFGERMAQVCRAMGDRRQAANYLGVSLSQLHRYLAGVNFPKIDVALRAASHGGVSLEWLVTGKGPKDPGPWRSAVAQQIDPELISAVTSTTLTFLDREGIALAPNKLAQLLTSLCEYAASREAELADGSQFSADDGYLKRLVELAR